MAKVKKVQLCKSCKAQLIEENQQACHKCGARQAVEQTGRIAVPDYVAHQRDDIYNDNVNKEGTFDVDSLDKEIMEYAKNSLDEDKIAAMRDAWMYLRVLVLSDCNVDTLRLVTKIGKHIGLLSTDIENYARHGGIINVSQPKIIEFDETELGDASPNN